VARAGWQQRLALSGANVAVPGVVSTHMLNDAVSYVRREVVNYLGVPDTDVVAGDITALKDDANRQGLYLSLVNAELESTLRNNGHAIRQNNTVRYQEPPVFLNLYLLFAADFQDYGTGLLRLSQTIELFQSKPTFRADNASAANPFPATLEKIIFDFCNLDFEHLNHLWGILGGAYLPSVVYKVRLVKVQRDVSMAAPEITTIQVVTNVR
jgi:hypothetical protein